MPFNLNFIFEKLRNWLPKAGAEIEAQASELEAKFTDDPASSFPPQDRKPIERKLQDLPPPDSDRSAIQSALEEAIGDWLDDQENANSLVILGSPVDDISALLTSAIETWERREAYAIQLGVSAKRPSDWRSLPEKLRSQLSVKFSEEKRPILVVIPDLSQCFLRCVEGLDGIEYLQNLAAQDRERFWLVGCNDWAWQYLDCVCQTGAYFEQTVSLPPLKEEQLKDWLSPVSDEFEIDFGEDDRDLDSDENWSDRSPNWRSQSELNYFKKLAKVSRGVARVAAQLCLLSLSRVEAESDEVKSSVVSALSQRVKLPDLPDLTQADRHFLYALLLQGNTSLSHLSISLDESESFIRSRIGILRRSDFLHARGDKLHVNPAHFFRIKSNLINNRFLVED
ncbi:MAG: hypothetical protein D6728_14215 [Cyanobacteria bacterium J055]|nr:MAG: hypothetical protein D6728_14215 [Cyanobacteria bacterium J055]